MGQELLQMTVGEDVSSSHGCFCPSMHLFVVGIGENLYICISIFLVIRNILTQSRHLCAGILLDFTISLWMVGSGVLLLIH